MIVRGIVVVASRGPAIVISSSGMATGGRVLFHLKRRLPDARTTVLLVGYQAAGTPGRAIQQHGPGGGWVQLDGERIPIRARITTLGAKGARIDRQGEPSIQVPSAAVDELVAAGAGAADEGVAVGAEAGNGEGHGDAVVAVGFDLPAAQLLLARDAQAVGNDAAV